MPIKPKTRGYVYFANTSSDEVKIGFTTDLHSRLTTLSTGSPTKLSLQFAFATTAESERLLHKHFAAERIRGEWFNLTFDIEELWDDLLDVQMMALGRGDGDNPDEVFIEPRILTLLLDSIGKEWPDEIKALRA